MLSRILFTETPDPNAGLPPAFGDLVKRVDALTKELSDAKANDASAKEIAALKLELADLKKQLAATPEPEADDDEPAPTPRKKKTASDPMGW